ncbi:hypothetical protein [Dongia sp.]|jgi:hypothetical protein|uniref:hypothetical protein n=1 Tax=Dongia sp. TaxID=1977262 RepID=UPI0035B23147
MTQVEMIIKRMEKVADRGLSLPVGHWGRELCRKIYSQLWNELQILLSETRRAS